ncbi:MAG: penicillin-binding transpeptidase domain-containing protein [Candidatus Cohnella colombiensis]|uniref:Penicillin-binding transpeptidase domain-containing protein n=1 Tax=Candidatus Cohnella colombiensis TaxID=3121368 RepID=A0AA95EV12_9BACL|nr:MAG: penicillin-binding transpeptidase domain-containing protein [Cohnella sp.]
MTNNSTEEAQKRELRNRRHFSFRLNVFFFATFFVFSALIVRLAFLQFVEGPSYKEQEHALGNRSVPVPPIRGNIYDSEGYPIAYSSSTQSLYYTFETKMTEERGRELAAKIVEVFDKYGDKTKKSITVDDVYEDMDLKNRVYYSYQQRRVKSGLTKEEIAYFSEHRDDFPGIDIVEESIRQYNEEGIAVQLVGYMKKLQGAMKLTKYQEINTDQSDPTLRYLKTEEVGVDGLELMYQDELRGYNGVKEYPVNKDSEIIGPMKLTKPVKGENLFLTINKDVQLATQNAITEHIAKIRNSTDKWERAANATTGYAVAMEIDTGKVIAMASMPDYDTNVWQGGISQKDLDQISAFMYNGTIKEVYPPYDNDQERKKHPSSFVYLGSTQKPLSVLVGLNEGLFTPTTTFNDIGYFEFGKEGHKVKVNNSQNAANGRINATQAIAKSSNAFMSAMIGNQLYLVNGTDGVDIWDNYMKQFGLGVTTGSGLPSESAGVVEYYNEAKKASPQSALIRSAWGQQGKYTALQLAQYTAMLANHGKRLKPQFVNEIRDVDGNVTQAYQTEVLNTVDYPDVFWSTIEKGMAQVQVKGFDDVQYTFLRKTGTSQQDVGGGRVENAVFIAYAPAENPKLAVAVIVPEGGFGGWGAAPIARKIFDAYDEKIGLNGTPRKPVVPATPIDVTNTDGTPVEAGTTNDSLPVVRTEEN